MIEVDLHLHTTFSDGRLTPTQLVDMAVARGLKYIAITDHDSTEGLAEALEAARKHDGLMVIPGVELSTDIPDGEAHMLAYHVDPHDAELQGTLARFRRSRVDRGRMMVEKLAALGMPVAWERVLELAGGGAVGRPHVARAMMERGFVASTQEAFDRYLGRNGAAYAEREKLTPEGAIEMALQAGALPVLAHPTFVKDLDRWLPIMKTAGLVGIEVYYAGYTPQDIQGLKEIADRENLIPCGGTDYHANGQPNESLPGSMGPPVSTVHRLSAARTRLFGSGARRSQP